MTHVEREKMARKKPCCRCKKECTHDFPGDCEYCAECSEKLKPYFETARKIAKMFSCIPNASLCYEYIDIVRFLEKAFPPAEKDLEQEFNEKFATK